jgi:hypothetical protein
MVKQDTRRESRVEHEQSYKRYPIVNGKGIIMALPKPRHRTPAELEQYKTEARFKHELALAARIAGEKIADAVRIEYINAEHEGRSPRIAGTYAETEEFARQALRAEAEGGHLVIEPSTAYEQREVGA